MKLCCKRGEETGKSCKEATSNTDKTSGLSLAQGDGDRGKEEGDGEGHGGQPVWKYNRFRVFIKIIFLCY
jgi:hypothetical protein